MIYQTFCFTTLWNYTILKQPVIITSTIEVLLPYGIKLFSNRFVMLDTACLVLLPYGITLFSNLSATHLTVLTVLLPYGITLFSNPCTAEYPFPNVLLSYGITLFSNCWDCSGVYRIFYYLMELHYSQTFRAARTRAFTFYYLMELHYSQTDVKRVGVTASFTTLWNYTILKQAN